MSARGTQIFRTIYKNRTLIWQLAKHKLREQYAATLLGSFWAILQPLMTILVFWFVFSYGFKPEFPGSTEIPFFLVLFCGLVPWMTFSDGLMNGTSAILSHQYLVKKIVFPLEILPVVQVVASFVVQFYLIVILMLILLFYGIYPSLYSFQIIYYIFAMAVFTTGLSWLLSALNVFHRDIGQSLNIIITLWFWMTPIVWPSKNLHGWVLKLVQLNPLYYIVDGYRSSFLYGQPFWQHYNVAMYFWFITFVMFAIGITFFCRVKNHFCDVL